MSANWILALSQTRQANSVKLHSANLNYRKKSNSFSTMELQMIDSIHLTFCKLRFQLSRLWIPIEPIVYDTQFAPGEEADEYQRFIVTHEFLRGYRLWHVSFRVFKPLSIKRLSLFDNKLAAILAACCGDRYGIWAVEDLLSRKYVPPVLDRLDLESKARVVAMADGLDEFVQLDWCWPGSLKYTTEHGERRLDIDTPSECQFEVTRSSDGFAEAVLLPYIISKESDEYPDGALVVSHTYGGEKVAGYAVAAQMPYFVASQSDQFSLGTLVVCVSPWHQEALAAGYDNAVSLKIPSPEEIYIHDLGMLDTEYAAMLAQQEAEE